ncbi:MAG: DUF362 domain-containing protein [Candidatus Woesearchaeota archaeon]|nr:MAG: DUF362 domain-containing protein [Candidatus Woesearchaeota archaeon]
MESKVYFTKELEKLAALVEDLAKSFKEREVAIKLHFGEAYPTYHIRPEIAKVIVDKLKELGFKPFLFDTNVAYSRGGRQNTEGHIKTAKANGFDFCEIRIGEEGEIVKTKGKLKEVEISKDLVEVPNMIVLSHFKGHWCASFGGAIKNLGMGAAMKNEKKREHTIGKPKFSEENCTGCGTCAELCPTSAIKLNEKATVDYSKCIGCGVCVRYCPNNALTSENYVTNMLVEVTSGVLSTFNPENIFYINVLEKISKLCDCNPRSEIICPDIGILASKDIVAIEKASVDLINEKVGKNLFKDVNRIDPMEQITAAQELGLGSKEYEIV